MRIGRAAWNERVRARWHRLKDRLLASFPGHVTRRSNELNLVHECLALAAQQTLCIIPLMAALSAVAQRFGVESVGTALADYLGLSVAAGRDVEDLFRGTGHVGFTTLVVGAVLSAVFAVGVAAIQQHAYEDIWYQERAGLRQIWRQLLWVVGVCVYLSLALYAGRFGGRLGRRVPSAGAGEHVLKLAFVLGVSYVFFWWSQRLLLAGRIKWRHLAPGALVMAAATTALVALSPLMSSQIVGQTEAYGLIGATFVLSIWLLALSVVVYFGCLVGAVWAERRLLGPYASGEAGAREAETDAQ